MFKYARLVFIALFLSVISVASVHNTKSQYDWIDHAEHIYLIYSEDGHGTGFAVKDHKGRVFIVTNRHVCGFQDTSGLKMKDYTGRVFPVTKSWISKTTDLCAIEAPPSAVPLEMANEITIGQHFTTAGYSLVQFMSQHEGRVIGEKETDPSWIAHNIPQELTEEQCLTYGIVKKYDANGQTRFYCQVTLTGVAVTDMLIGAGASGSPIIDDDNKVIGVLFGGRSLGGPIVLASFLRIELLKDFLKSI